MNSGWWSSMAARWWDSPRRPLEVGPQYQPGIDRRTEQDLWDGTANDMPHQLSAITANSGTGMAEALSIAYIEIQKAHMRDLNSDGVDTRLNSIVLLTDGVPSAITLYANDPSSGNANNIVTGSTRAAVATTRRLPPRAPRRHDEKLVRHTGTALQHEQRKSVRHVSARQHRPAAAHTSNWWMQNGGSDAANPNPQTPYTGCTSMMNNSGNTTYNYFSKIPAQDAYGNQTNTGNYVNSHITGGGSVTTIYNGTALDVTKPNRDYHWGWQCGMRWTVRPTESDRMLIWRTGRAIPPEHEHPALRDRIHRKRRLRRRFAEAGGQRRGRGWVQRGAAAGTILFGFQRGGTRRRLPKTRLGPAAPGSLRGERAAPPGGGGRVVS